MARVSSIDAVLAADVSRPPLGRFYRSGQDAVAVLAERTGASEIEAEAALWRAVDEGLIAYGSSIRTCWPTPAGRRILQF